MIGVNNFVSKLFIFIGEENHYYTLRESYVVEKHVGDGVFIPEVRFQHIKNLSQNPDEAFRKAEEYAEMVALELATPRDRLEGMLNEIKKRTAEQMEAARIKAEKEAQERIEQRRVEFEAAMADGLVPFGRYKGEKLTELPVGYINWLYKQLKEDELDKSSDFYVMAVAIVEANPDKILPEPINEWFGKEKQRIELDVTVVLSTYYDRPSFGWGGGMERVNVIGMVDSNGYYFMSMTPSFYVDVGVKLRIRGTIKKHDEYKDQKQTFLQRINVLKNYADEE